MDAEGQARFDRAQARVMWVLWLTYGAFYFCRSNISAAVPGIGAELDLSKAEIGTILGALKISYGVGQLVNGQLAERIGARRLLALGMLVSAGLNVLFGLATGFYFLLFIWACNGYFQALGWPPTMRVAAAWFPPAMRGRAISVIGTGYQLTGAITFVIAGGAAEWLGWRGALYVPAALLAATAIIMLATLQEAPEGEHRSAGGAGPAPVADGHSWLSTVAVTLSNGRLWLLAGALGLLNATRYGFLDWGIAHLMEVQAHGVGASALKYSVGQRPVLPHPPHPGHLRDAGDAGHADPGLRRGGANQPDPVDRRARADRRHDLRPAGAAGRHRAGRPGAPGQRRGRGRLRQLLRLPGRRRR
jgi:sugar phosphate permease